MAWGGSSFVLTFACCLRVVVCQDVSPAPATASYLRRIGHTVSVIGDWLFIDGGEVSQREPGGNIIKDPNGEEQWSLNDTLSLPLRSSWNNETVPILVQPKSAPVFWKAALFTSGDSMVMWGGLGSKGKLPDSKMPWQWTATGSGGGTWDTVTPSNSDFEDQFVRTSGASKTTCNGTGLYLGGWVGGETDSGLGLKTTDNLPVPGLLTYDMATRTWTNESADGFHKYGTNIGGAATCVQGFGERGLFMSLGGNWGDLGTYVDDGSRLIDMGTVSFWDVATKKWYSQITTGETPTVRDRHCVAGVQSPNGTYEIYLYGGQDSRHNDVFSDVWILSLPAFAWFKTEAAGTPRNDHECVVVGNQMISVGGADGKANWSSPDPWSQGLGVLELSTLTWTTGYSPDTTYSAPQMVKEWYAQNDYLNDVAWSDEEVKTLFTIIDTSPSSTSPDPSESSSSSESGSSDSSPSSSPGAIAGGTIGGVAGVTAIALLVWFLRRRQRRQPKASAPAAVSIPRNRAELDQRFQKDAELNAESKTLYALPLSHKGGPPVELEADTNNDQYGHGELPGTQVERELEDTSPALTWMNSPSSNSQQTERSSPVSRAWTDGPQAPTMSARPPANRWEGGGNASSYR
ncbi:hypothetical protein F4778DRAFT_544958 [Xylariomycetidae sp. FL2044]|nr:hypothetical protein F4778DRAFT_544958 [Xylariomycetidae sp. FL2044]